MSARCGHVRRGHDLDPMMALRALNHGKWRPVRHLDLLPTGELWFECDGRGHNKWNHAPLELSELLDDDHLTVSWGGPTFGMLMFLDPATNKAVLVSLRHDMEVERCFMEVQKKGASRLGRDQLPDGHAHDREADE